MTGLRYFQNAGAVTALRRSSILKPRKTDVSGQSLSKR
jgi:hypothetical protein